MNLTEQLHAIHASLSEHDVPHAFGGAIALGFWTIEARGTRDIDVNLFIPPDQWKRALDALPDGVVIDEADIEAIRRDGQARLRWDDTPIDVFFSNLPIHDKADRHQHEVEYEGQRIPILGPLELAVFKAMFDRLRDWGDIQEMFAAKTLDPDALRDELTTLIGPEDRRFARIDEALEGTEG